MKPKVFIGSSSESRKLVQEVRILLSDDADVYAWYDIDVFKPGLTFIEDLLDLCQNFDFAVFIFGCDDEIKRRGQTLNITRDNVIFEYGLFVANIGRKNSFILAPNDKSLHILSDLSGVNILKYNNFRDHLNSALAIPIQKIRNSIQQWTSDLSSNKQNSKLEFFSKYIAAEEPPFWRTTDIDFTRSFKLLLHMFSKEEFIEFRAFDQAFHRWMELINNEVDSTAHINNTSKDILEEQISLIQDRRCENFKRILLIPENSLQPKTFEVLRIIQREEKKAFLFSDNENKPICETKILCCPNEHEYLFKKMNDFALFTGKDEEFAIVETSIVSPYRVYTEETCIILTEFTELNRRKERFDFFWENEAISIDNFIGEFHSEDKSDTVLKAFKQYISSLTSSKSINTTSILIETAYVDLRNTHSNRRKVHYERAFELLDYFVSLPIHINNRNNLYVNTFISDFTISDKGNLNDCDDDCTIIEITPERKKAIKEKVDKEFTKRNKSFNLNEDNITTFYMTKTRNKAVNFLKKLKKSTNQNNPISFKSVKESIKNIYIHTDDIEDVYIGYEKDGYIVPNCVLLMAQHYYDLFEFAYKKNPANKVFWIFDFLIHGEKNAVERGADVAKVLFEWPKNITLNIINCSYFENEDGEVRKLGPFIF